MTMSMVAVNLIMFLQFNQSKLLVLLTYFRHLLHLPKHSLSNFSLIYFESSTFNWLVPWIQLSLKKSSLSTADSMLAIHGLEVVRSSLRSVGSLLVAK